MRFLLDTNIIAEIRKRDRGDPNVVGWVLETPAKDLCTSVLVLAEIRRGIELKRRHDPVQAGHLDLWMDGFKHKLGPRIIGIDDKIAQQWARLNVPDPLPFVDGLLAATALVLGLTLVTRNSVDISRTGVVWLNPFVTRA